jgi:AMP nucleosidase
MNEEKDVKKDETIVAKAKKVKEVNSAVKAGLKTKAEIVKNWLPIIQEGHWTNLAIIFC